MGTVDIRKKDDGEVNRIRVEDDDSYRVIANILTNEHGYVCITDSHESSDELEIANKDHALNLIKGIQKAIELGWFD